MSDTSESLMKKRFRGYMPVVVDVETAGFNAKTDALLEIAAVLLDFDSDGTLKPVDSVHYNVEPFEGANIEQAAIDFNGIDPNSPLRGAVLSQRHYARCLNPLEKHKKQRVVSAPFLSVIIRTLTIVLSWLRLSGPI